ncbi:hypothetical protein HDC92_003773 [Pedobacter sp. AK017]|nr:hypothetical protein [Pedobacter sp. AK017]MBB5440075.1 hypothetical protein [Pedobacter sp. AK017]
MLSVSAWRHPGVLLYKPAEITRIAKTQLVTNGLGTESGYCNSPGSSSNLGVD